MNIIQILYLKNIQLLLNVSKNDKNIVRRNGTYVHIIIKHNRNIIKYYKTFAKY